MFKVGDFITHQLFTSKYDSPYYFEILSIEKESFKDIIKKAHSFLANESDEDISSGAFYFNDIEDINLKTNWYKVKSISENKELDNIVDYISENEISDFIKYDIDSIKQEMEENKSLWEKFGK